jgi:hypothetical protein
MSGKRLQMRTEDVTGLFWGPVGTLLDRAIFKVL